MYFEVMEWFRLYYFHVRQCNDMVIITSRKMGSYLLLTKTIKFNITINKIYIPIFIHQL